MQKKEGGDGVAYARKEAYEYEGTQYEADIQNGDKVTIKDSGIVESHAKFGDQHKFIISTRNGDKRTNFNQKTINAMVDAFGDESEDWVGKEVTVATEKTIISGERRIVAYFLPTGFILDEWGDIVKDEPDVPRDQATAPTGRQVADAAQTDVGDIESPF